MGMITRNRDDQELCILKSSPLGKKLWEVTTIAENLQTELGAFLFRTEGTFSLGSCCIFFGGMPVFKLTEFKPELRLWP